jgi:hypothetical protein
MVGRCGLACRADARQDRPQRGQPGRQFPLGGRRLVAHGLQQRLGQRPVRRASSGRYRPPGHGKGPGRAGMPGQFPHQPGLADPGFTGDEHHAALTRHGTGQGIAQRGLLSVPPEHNGT